MPSNAKSVPLCLESVHVKSNVRIHDRLNVPSPPPSVMRQQPYRLQWTARAGPLGPWRGVRLWNSCCHTFVTRPVTRRETEVGLLTHNVLRANSFSEVKNVCTSLGC